MNFLFPATSSVRGGDFYGSLYRPTLIGSRGGASGGGVAGGRGGGTVHIRVRRTFLLDGDVYVDGLAGQSGSGGGSGGSAWIAAG